MLALCSKPETPNAMRLQDYIRDIPDFPKPGILFKDITPLLREPNMLDLAVRELATPYRGQKLTAVVACEARGFVFGSLVARELGIGFIPLRKPGKLPADTHSVSYETEYSLARLEVHQDALDATDQILLIDDLIATGGTAAAAHALIQRSGATLAACAFVIELRFLNGRKRLNGQPVHSLLQYD